MSPNSEKRCLHGQNNRLWRLTQPQGHEGTRTGFIRSEKVCSPLTTIFWHILSTLRALPQHIESHTLIVRYVLSAGGLFYRVLLIYLRQQIVGPSAKRATAKHERSIIGRAERANWRPLRPINGGPAEPARAGIFCVHKLPGRNSCCFVVPRLGRAIVPCRFFLQK